jgi:protein ImuB
VFVSMVVCVLLPRFELAVAAGGRDALLGLGPAALAPESGREQFVGEVSSAAEAAGVHRGMRLGEALSRCPSLALLPPDPVGVADEWEGVVRRLEAVGAAVESERPGSACFEASGLRRLYGGRVLDDVAPALRRLGGEPPPWLDAVVAVVRRALALPARIGAGPSRFCAIAGAARARSRRPELVAGAVALAGEPVTLLRRCEETAGLVEPLERLGITTLGALAALGRPALADRFGLLGLRAHGLALGQDTPLRSRVPGETVQESLELPEAASGVQAQRALELLIDQLLATPARKGRTLRAVVLSAKLVEGGTWQERVVFRESLADAARMRLVLSLRLALLPAPASTLRLAVDRFGPPHAPGAPLFEDATAVRRARLREAVRQARLAAGPDAALRVLCVEPDSRVPERRAVLAPFE